VAVVFAGTSLSVPVSMPLAQVISKLKAAYTGGSGAGGAHKKTLEKGPSQRGMMSPLNSLPR